MRRPQTALQWSEMQDDNELINIPREWQWLADEPVSDIDDEDIPDTTRTLVDLIGYEQTLRIIAYFGGQSLYVPKWERAFKTLRDRRINREFDGFNHKQLARQYGVSESTIRLIVGK